MDHMAEIQLIDNTSLHVNQTLADFTILAARSIEQDYLTINAPQEKEKKLFRFW